MPKLNVPSRDAVLRARVSAALLVRVEAAAQKSGQTVSEWLRALLLKELGK